MKTAKRCSPAALPVAGRHDHEPAVRRRALVGIAENAARGLDRALYATPHRKLGLALRRSADELLTEMPVDQRTPSARALAWSIALTKLRRDTLNGIVLELGPRIVSKKERRAYPLLAQLNETERLLADLLRQWNELRFDTDIMARIEALEEGRKVIDGTP